MAPRRRRFKNVLTSLQPKKTVPAGQSDTDRCMIGWQRLDPPRSTRQIALALAKG